MLCTKELYFTVAAVKGNFKIRLQVSTQMFLDHLIYGSVRLDLKSRWTVLAYQLSKWLMHAFEKNITIWFLILDLLTLDSSLTLSFTGL